MANSPKQSFDKPVQVRYNKEHVGGAFDAKNIPRPEDIDVAMKVESLKESMISSLSPVGISSMRYGVPKFISRKPEPRGKGKIDPPGQRPFIPRQPVEKPIISGPHMPVFWNTDPDIWDLTKLVGPEFWDGPDVNGPVYM